MAYRLGPTIFIDRHAAFKCVSTNSFEIHLLASSCPSACSSPNNLTNLEQTWCGGPARVYPDWVDNEIYAYKNKHSLRSNTKGYGGKTQ
jgi:hypothetical protein